MYKLVQQSVTEARQKFTKSLNEIDSDRGVVIVVRKRGEPIAGIVAMAELEKYFGWLAEQTRIHETDSPNADETAQGTAGMLADPSHTEDEEHPSTPSKSLSAGQGEAQTTPPESEADWAIPEGIDMPDVYARRYLDIGYSPEEVTLGLKQHYGKHGLTDEQAERIVDGIAGRT